MNDDNERDIQEKKRYEVMDDEEIKLGNKYLDWYRSSWRDKEQRGLFDKWEEIEMYWEGEANPPEGDNDPASNTNIIHPNIEGQVALLVEQNIAIQPRPVSPSDLPFSDTVKVILEWIKEKNRMKRKLDVHERQREKFGTGIFRVLFDPDFMDGFGLPVIEPCNPAYVFVDPTITNVYKIQEGRFIIETVNKSIHWAEENFDEEIAQAIMPGYHPMESELIFGETDGENDEISRDSYLHMYVWSKKKGQLRLVQMSGCGVVLSDSDKDDEEESYFPKAIYPYFFTPLYFREGTVWGKGDAELLLNTQDLIDDLDDQIRINARLTGNVQKVVGANSGIDVSKWTNEPALNIPANDVNDWRLVQPAAMPQYIINRRDTALNNERQIVTRFSDQMTGVRQRGVDTATEALALQQAGASGIDHKKIILQESMAGMFDYCLDLAKENYTEEQAFRITEKQNDFIWFRGSDLKSVPKLIKASDSYRNGFQKDFPDAINLPEWMPLIGEGGIPETKEAMFDIEVTVGAGLPTNKAFVYQAIKEAFQAGAITVQEFRKLLKEFVGLPIDETMPPPPMPELPPELAGLLQNQGIQQNSDLIQNVPNGDPAALQALGGGQ